MTVDVTAAPLGVTDEGLKVQAANEGRPEQENVVAAAKPLSGVMLIVEDAALPSAAVAFAGDNVTEKSGEPSTVRITGSEVDGELLASPA